jgi:hypothetical protein
MENSSSVMGKLGITIKGTGEFVKNEIDLMVDRYEDAEYDRQSEMRSEGEDLVKDNYLDR